MGGKGSGGNSRPSGYRNDKSKKRDKAIGTRWDTQNYGWLEVIGYIDNKNVTVKFDNTGNIRYGIKMTAIRNGRVADESSGLVQLVSTKYPAGFVFEMEDGDKAYVIEAISHDKIIVRLESSGEEGVATKEQLRKGICPLKIKSKVDEWNYLKVDTSKYYVYMCKYRGYLLYVGMGKMRRYLHPNSGTSHSFDLNEFFFLCGGVEVSIYKDCLEKDDALFLEKLLIYRLKPPFNKSGLQVHP